ncbi:ATP-binding protein [Streptomyces solincola]|uniref:ATP-binding protein n=1 Tax=Streptomyces solincola TaxID=2100817 RepID=A0A2S9PVZ5_9ACTN|nr:MULTISPECIES: ATP-binding protein [Streptomyces]PRH78585.1 ATP-binding protein [Streptomyces solincola]
MGTNGSTVLAPLRQGLMPIDAASVSSSASCALPARFEAVRGAREFTSTTLSRWELSDRFDDVALVVSELVTNALRHAVPEGPAGDPGPRDAPVRLHLMRWTGRLVCAVRDPSSECPTARETEEDFAAESGRGLLLVESFSDGWGWHPLAGTLRGKVVWALFRLPEPAACAGTTVRSLTAGPCEPPGAP